MGENCTGGLEITMVWCIDHMRMVDDSGRASVQRLQATSQLAPENIIRGEVGSLQDTSSRSVLARKKVI